MRARTALSRKSQIAAGILCMALAWPAGAQRPPAASNFALEKDVPVPMRDGVRLRADILRPANGGRSPTLVYRTPYGKQNAQKDYTTFRRAVERGYAVVIEDVRGRYASEGEFNAYREEGRDGFDTIEWAARQPWSNGRVGTFGLSYPGAVQWLAAMESPPHLKAMVPAMTFSTPRQFFYSGETFDLSWIDWIWNNIAPNTRARKHLAGATTYQQAAVEWKQRAAGMKNFLPLAQLPALKDVAPYYYEWLRHPPEDPWWAWAELAGKYGRVQAAVLNLSGWYDEDYGPQGAIANFQGLLATRTKQKDAGTQLLLGPWMHGVDATASTKSGEREFGARAAIDYDEVVLRWMDHYLREVDNGVEREARVRYFVMGENAWRTDTSWPPRDALPRAIYFDQAASGGAPGTLNWNAGRRKKASFSEFVSDPAHPVTDAYEELGAHDYRDLAQRSDVLVFDSQPLPRDLEVSGSITAEIYFSCDAPDTDLWVRVEDVAPDGTVLNLMSPGGDVLRASYRQGGPRKLLRRGRIYRLRLPHLVTSNVFKAGHRIRAQISGEFFPRFSRNLHSGERESVSAKMQPARIRIYHDVQHRSRLALSVVAGH